MSNFLLMQAGYEPINIQAESCARYISAIRAFQTEEDPYPFAAFFCLNLEDHLLKIIEMLEPGSTSSCATGPSRINSYLTEYAALIAESTPLAAKHETNQILRKIYLLTWVNLLLLG